MMIFDYIGPPQLAALLLLAQRGFEELYSQRNTKQLLSQGGYEVGADYYPVVAVTHLGWIASIFFLIPAHAPLSWTVIVLYLILQVIRYWVIATIGPYWTHRIITLDKAPIVKKGPYNYIRHPNYVVTLIETGLLPLAFGAWGISIIMTAIWGSVLHYKIILEDGALESRRQDANG